MRTAGWSLLAVAVGLFLAGCATDPTAGGMIRPTMSGTVTYRARMALPPSAVLTVRLLDITRPDAPAVVLSERSISNPGNPPIPFELSYPFGGIVAGRHYVIEARIEIAGRLKFYSSEPHDVTPQNAAQPHDVVVELAKDE